MIVITVSSCPPSLRGDLSKWLFEVQTGVYVGNPGKRVREMLWERVKATIKSGRAVLVYSARCEQGFEIQTYHTTSYPKNFDGLQLMFHPEIKREVISEEIPKVKVPVLSQDKLQEQAKKAFPRESVFPDSFVVLDFETTGLDPEKDGITEIGAIKVIDCKPKEEFSSLIRTDRVLSAEASKLTGITNEMLKEFGLDEKTALEKLKEFCDDLPVVCHNAKFDLKFLQSACIRYGVSYWTPRVIDTLQLSRKYIKGIPNYRLQTLLAHFDIENEQQHRALPDCKLTLIMLEKLKEIAAK